MGRVPSKGLREFLMLARLGSLAMDPFLFRKIAQDDVHLRSHLYK
jgi:hypothetical protein